jgi:hypothetical protein
VRSILEFFGSSLRDPSSDQDYSSSGGYRCLTGTLATSPRVDLEAFTKLYIVAKHRTDEILDFMSRGCSDALRYESRAILLEPLRFTADSASPPSRPLIERYESEARRTDLCLLEVTERLVGSEARMRSVSPLCEALHLPSLLFAGCFVSPSTNVERRQTGKARVSGSKACSCRFANEREPMFDRSGSSSYSYVLHDYSSQVDGSSLETTFDEPSEKARLTVSSFRFDFRCSGLA